MTGTLACAHSSSCHRRPTPAPTTLTGAFGLPGRTRIRQVLTLLHSLTGAFRLQNLRLSRAAPAKFLLALTNRFL